MPGGGKKRSMVQEKYEERRGFYSGAHAQMRRADRIYHQHFDGLVDVPYDVRIFQSSTAANIVEGFRNQIRTSEPTVDFRPSGPSVAAEKHAILMQKVGYGFIRREREFSVLDPNIQLGADLLLRGAACKRILVNVDEMMEDPPSRKGSDAYKRWEDRAMRSWPFQSMAIDPLSVFPHPGQKKPSPSMIERQTRYAGQVEADYPHWRNPHYKSETSPVEVLIYYTDTEYYMDVDGDVVDAKENPYGFVPYIFEWSGMGRNHADADPAHLAVGILTSIMGELEEEVRLKTAISVQTQMHVFPPILTVEDAQKVAKEFGVGPGKVIRHPPGHPPQYMEYPPPNENMYRFLEVIHENISRVQSRALSGGRDPGVRYGVLQAQQIGQALTAIAPILSTLDVMATRSLNMMAALARAMDVHMVVGGTKEEAEAPIRVSGKDFTHLNYDVTFEAVDPAENDRALLVGESLRRAGDISRRTLWKKYAKHVVEDPDEEDAELMAEKTIEMLIASGALGTALLSEDVQEQLRQDAAQAVDTARGEITQNRRQDTVPESAALEAQRLEATAGRPGQLSIPRDVAEQGMAAASPSRSGLPRT